MSDTFYLTTPIYYVNARPHIGHAYTTIVADVLARRSRAQGRDTWFLTGTDEHGQKIERSALAAGIPPQQFADEVSATFQTLWQRMGITNDQYIRTSSAEHKRGVQKLFAELYAKGEIYLSTYTGQYSIGEEMFVEGPPGTIGPDGRPTETVTEENFFFKLSEYQLKLLDLIESNTLKITPESSRNEVLSFLRGNTNEIVNEFLSMQPNISEDAVDANDAIAWGESSGRIGRTQSGTVYVPGALRDLSVSRSSFTWGIPVPEPAASASSQKHVIYVWLDALANYMTAVGYGDDSEDGRAKFEKCWPADLHLVGKEITRFHCVYWPAFLMAAGLDLPKAITAHGWLLFDDSKMSKSKGNIVRTETILDAFGTLCPPASPNLSSLRGESGEAVAVPELPTKQDRDLFAADVLRYYLLREIPFGQDGSFSFEALITRYNADLANGYGNLVSRTLKMIQNYFEASIPEMSENMLFEIAEFKAFQERASFKNGFTPTLISQFEGREFDRFLQGMSVYVGIVDETLSLRTPWKQKDNEEHTDRNRRWSLYYAAESIRIITALLHPILPYATAKVWRQLGLGDIERASDNGELRTPTWGGLQPGTKLGPVSPIFPRADKGLAQTMSDMEQEKSTPIPSTFVDETFNASPVTPEDPTHPGAPPRAFGEASTVAGSTAHTTERPGTPSHAEAPASGIFSGQGPADASPQITIDDFVKVELRVAQILVCERIPKADKLLRLEVDLGYEKRQILSGIAEWYTPEDLIGRRIVVITNLAPRKMRGLESHGMLLAASTEGAKPHLATFTGAEDLPLGSRLK